MGRLSAFVAEWRETYAAYPAATVLVWVELLVGLALVPAALVYPAFQSRLPTAAGVALVAAGAGFVVWFVVLRSVVVDRLVQE
jgi:hypothetical protein